MNVQSGNFGLAAVHSQKAWTKACVPSSIISGFQLTGISPFQPDKWYDDDFALAVATDCNAPQPEVSSLVNSLTPAVTAPDSSSRSASISSVSAAHLPLQ